jgi:hypothetical protein
LLLVSTLPWLVLLIPPLIAGGAVAADDVSLFMMAIVIHFFFVIAAFFAAIGIAVYWSSWILHVRWSLRGGEVGPWSGRRAHVVAFLALLMPQWLGAFGVVWLFPDYPAGWP